MEWHLLNIDWKLCVVSLVWLLLVLLDRERREGGRGQEESSQVRFINSWDGSIINLANDIQQLSVSVFYCSQLQIKYISLKMQSAVMQRLISGRVVSRPKHSLMGFMSQVTAAQHWIIWICKVAGNFTYPSSGSLPAAGETALTARRVLSTLKNIYIFKRTLCFELFRCFTFPLDGPLLWDYIPSNVQRHFSYIWRILINCCVSLCDSLSSFLCFSWTDWEETMLCLQYPFISYNSSQFYLVSSQIFHQTGARSWQ